MPYNGSGTFNSLGVPTFPAVTGEYILASYFNATMNDVFLGLSTALPRDGQAAMSAALAMANFKITGLANGSNPQDAVTYSQVFTGGSFTDPVLLGVVNAAGATSVTVPSPTYEDNSQKAVPTSYLVSYYAKLASPALTGIPTAPTAAYGTDTDQIATMAAIKDAIDLLPSGALPSVTGKDTTWNLTPNSGGTGVQWTQSTGSGGTTATGSVTLTVSSASALSVTPTGPGLYVTLPAATTLAKSAHNYSVRNAGSFDYGVKDGAGNKLGWVRAGSSATLGLADNSTAAGVWVGAGLTPFAATGQLVMTSGANTSDSYTYAVTLDTNRTCVFFGYNNLYAVVYDSTTGAFGTPVLVRSGLGNNISTFSRAILSSTDRVLVVSSDNTTALQAVVLSISSSAITVNSATAVVLAGNCTAVWDLIAVGTSWVVSYSHNVPQSNIRAITISGTTPTIGAESGVITGGNGVFLYAAGSVVRTIGFNTGNTLTATPYTVSGSTLTLGTAATAVGTSALLKCFQNAGGNLVATYINGTLFGAVIKLTGTTEAISTATIGAAPGTASLLSLSYVPVSATKTAVGWISIGATAYNFNLIVDTAGTMSAGTSVANTLSGGSVTTQAILGQSAFSASVCRFIITASGDNKNMLYQMTLDTSGASPSISSAKFYERPNTNAAGYSTWPAVRASVTNKNDRAPSSMIVGTSDVFIANNSATLLTANADGIYSTPIVDPDMPTVGAVSSAIDPSTSNVLWSSYPYAYSTAGTIVKRLEVTA